ncbi:MAG: hypothetical protein M0R77_14980 [Gammaproteobacteria bacterium]|jgi:uncharacterized protein YlxW (UPF0749 family)|nr:hypothetical protein [Gammaproteobacteria bacterium]
MFGIPWSYVGIFIALVGVIATGYFAVQHYNSVVAENVKLESDLKSEKAKNEQLQKNYEAIVDTVNKNDQSTQTIIERTNTIEKQIRAAPVTTNCVSSPALTIALDRLKENYQPTQTPTDTSKTIPADSK